MSETTLNFLLLVTTLIGTVGSAYIAFERGKLLVKQKNDAELKSVKDKATADSIRQVDKAAFDLQRQKDQDEIKMGHEKIESLQKEIELRIALGAEKNRKSIENKMVGANSQPRLIPLYDTDAWYLAWENTGTDPAYVELGYFIIKWVDESGGIQENPKQDIAKITVPVTPEYTILPRFPVTLPEGGIQIFVFFVTLHGVFIEDMYLLRDEQGGGFAYIITDVQNKETPTRYFMDESFEYSKSPITHPLDRTWPKERPGGGPFRRGHFVLEQPGSQSAVQEKAPY